MECRSGRTARTLAIALLLLCAACKRESSNDAYRAARDLADRNEIKAASAKVDAALTRFSNEDSEGVWSLKMLRAELLLRSGKEREGLGLITPPLPERYASSEAAVRRLLILAMTEKTPARFEEALALAQRGQPQLLPEVHIAIANFSSFAEAERHAGTAIELARALRKDLVVANAYGALAYAYQNAGRWAEAIDANTQALQQYERSGVQARIARVAGNLGYEYAMIGDDDTAEEYFNRALAAAEKAEIPSERMTWLNQLGNVAFDRGQLDDADRRYAEAMNVANANGAKAEAQYAANRARVALDRRQIEQAEQFNTRALTLKRAQKDEEAELLSLILEARIEAARGQIGRAEQTLRAVSTRTTNPRTRWEAQARLAELYAGTGHHDLADKEFRRALETAGLVRADLGTNVEITLSFFNLVAEIYDNYIDFLVQRNRGEEALAVTELSRAQSLEDGLGIETVAQKLDARAIAKQRNATILCYWLGHNRAYLWVVTPSSVTIHPLPSSKSIETELAAYRRELIGVDGTLAASGDRGRALYRMLVEPASAITKDMRVIVVADRKLHELNFETLVNGDHYWIEDAILSSASSLQLLAHRSKDRVNDGSILLVGNAPTVEESYPHLEHAWSEIASIQRHFRNPKVLNDRAATPMAYREAKPVRFEYLHFVAHGVASRQRPLESAVILSRDRSGYKLFARDIIKEPLHARLVTISSCHGAGTRTYTGEGLVGLAWAFLAAGSENVIGALWEVKDSATPKLMEQMYVELRAGADPAVALRNAKLALVRSQGIQRKPTYWAPFVLYTGRH